MIVWRISQAKNADNALSGEGAYRFPGRWNGFGTPVVYTASSASLAILEYVAHLGPNVATSRELMLLKIETPNSVQNIDDRSLPSGWDTIPLIQATRLFGDAWARSKASLCLSVPSVIMPSRSEFNLVINPLHPEMPRVTIVEHQPFTLDHRML